MQQIIRNAIFLGGNYPGRNCSGPIIFEATIRGTIIHAGNDPGAVFWGEIVLAGNYPWGQLTVGGGNTNGDNHPGANGQEDSYPRGGGNFPRGQFFEHQSLSFY